MNNNKLHTGIRTSDKNKAGLSAILIYSFACLINTNLLVGIKGREIKIIDCSFSQFDNQ